MLDAFISLVTVEWSRVMVQIAICLHHQTTRNLVGGNPFVRDCVNLNPIACRKHQRLRTTNLARDGFGCGVTRELLPRCHVRGVMAQSNTEQSHDAWWSSAVNVTPHKSARAALKPMMHSAATRFGASHLKCRACKMAA